MATEGENGGGEGSSARPEASGLAAMLAAQASKDASSERGADEQSTGSGSDPPVFYDAVREFDASTSGGSNKRYSAPPSFSRLRDSSSFGQDGGSGPTPRTSVRDIVERLRPFSPAPAGSTKTPPTEEQPVVPEAAPTAAPVLAVSLEGEPDHDHESHGLTERKDAALVALAALRGRWAGAGLDAEQLPTDAPSAAAVGELGDALRDGLQLDRDGRGSPAGAPFVWSEELEFVYQLLHSEEIHQVLATADASWDSNVEIRHKLADKDVRDYIRINYSAEAADDEDDDDEEIEVQDLETSLDLLPHTNSDRLSVRFEHAGDEVHRRLKAPRRSSIAAHALRTKDRRGSGAASAGRMMRGDSDLDASSMMISRLAETHATTSKLLELKARIMAGDEDLSIFALREEVADPLTFVTVSVFTRYGLNEAFGIGCHRLMALCTALNKGYHADNQFHNEMHAADVLYATHVLVCKSGVEEGWELEQTHLLALFFAAVVHDFRHPGVTNAYLINSNDPLAMTYNDRSVLENYHVSEAFKLMLSPELNIFHTLEPKQHRELRQLVVKMVLATDMAEHFAQVTELVSTAQAPKQEHGHSRADSLMPIDRFLPILLHSADISHPFRSLPAHIEWSRRLRDEFFSQGDAERQRGLPLSPMCDRAEGVGQAKFAGSQIGFMEALVQPLLEGICMHLPPLRPLLSPKLDAALAHWKEQRAVATDHSKTASPPS